jgi:glycogen debranching enzyme
LYQYKDRFANRRIGSVHQKGGFEMEHEQYDKIVSNAKKVLEGNWIGYGTKPAPNLYPHQWSWDSAFIAMGYSHYDIEKAKQELRSYFKGQWQNGLLPHIVFNPQAADYKPGPEFWRTENSPDASRDPLTSGMIQPPIHATAVWHIWQYAKNKEDAREFLKEMFPKLNHWHQYLYTHRNPDGDGLLYIFHPWESGQDNSPIWDSPFKRIDLKPEDIPNYERVDTEIADAEDRPKKWAYDRYAYLVNLAAENNYDDEKIAGKSPFLIKDVLFNTIAVEANRDLAKIAEIIGEDSKSFNEWADLTAQSIDEKLWDEEHAIYFDYDMKTGKHIHSHVAAGFTPIYAGIPSKERAQKICDRLNTHSYCELDHQCFAVPSYDKLEPGFSVNRYWRGPIWINMNWLLYHGLRSYGMHEYAERVKETMLTLTSQFGLYEYYDPEEGKGHGASNFSWTSALIIDLHYEEEHEQPEQEEL